MAARTKSKVKPKHKTKYRVTNWCAYEAALRRRGDITVWFDEAAVGAWKSQPSGRPGGQRKYSDLAIVTALYGIWQYRVAPEDVSALGELARERHGATVFYDIPGIGGGDFRAYSTFTFPAPFAAFMVFAILFAAGIAISRGASGRRRLLATLLIPLFFIGITVSGGV